VVCESQVYNAVVDWVKYDVNSRRHSLNKLIKNVRCHLIKPEFISKQLENCEIVRSTCYDYLTKVLENLKDFIPIESKSRQLDIPQVIYVIKCVPVGSDETSVESAKFFLFKTKVGFRLPKLCLPYCLLKNPRCAVINGFIYVLTFDGDIDRYDPISNQWKKCKRLDKRFYLPEMVAMQNELYVSEGSGENRLMKYDPIADEWTERASLNKNRCGFGCTVFNRKLYVVGGGSRFGHQFGQKKVDEYNPINNKWTSITPMLTPRRDLAIVTLGNYIYAIGGENDEGTLKTVERYDVLNDKWESVASMKHERFCSEAVVFNKKIYVFGKSFLIFEIFNQNFYNVCNHLHDCDVSLLIVSGGCGENFGKIVECYDEETNEWNEVARMNERANQLIVSYKPCVPEICENFPF